MYIYKDVWKPLKMFISHCKSVILMKQVKYHNVFIYYTKYKSSLET